MALGAVVMLDLPLDSSIQEADIGILAHIGPTFFVELKLTGQLHEDAPNRQHLSLRVAIRLENAHSHTPVNVRVQDLVDAIAKFPHRPLQIITGNVSLFNSASDLRSRLSIRLDQELKVLRDPRLRIELEVLNDAHK